MGFFESLPRKGPVKRGCGIQAVVIMLMASSSLLVLALGLREVLT